MDDQFYLGLTRTQKAVAAKCTPLEREFVVQWIALGCDPSKSLEALVKAYGDNPPKVKDNTLRQRVKRMMDKQSVNDFIDIIRQHSIHTAIMEKEEAQLILSQKARSNIDDILEWNEYIAGYDENEEPVIQTAWRIKNIKDMPAHVKAAIKSVSIDSSGRPKIELYDSNAATRLLAEIKGWKAPIKNEITGKNGTGLDLGLDPSKVDEQTLKVLLEQSTQKIMDAL